ncbi:MAG: restriction endonuclease, partial [Anaerolineaceae bacterium 4572_78]
LTFAEEHGYVIVLPKHQNYYPDLSFIKKDNHTVKFAVDFKTTYRVPNYPDFCNGFTLGSHGAYFVQRDSSKNIQFPYKDYMGHFCLGIIYSRNPDIDEFQTHDISNLHAITSVIHNFAFFIAEKWKIASDKRGSGNTANIGSINKIPDIVHGQGMFSKLGEKWFDDYWMNYGKITITTSEGKTKKITNLVDFVQYRDGDVNLIVTKAKKRRTT